MIGGSIGRCEAEDVGIADRLGSQSGTKRVSKDSAQPRVGAAVGFDGTGSIVRFDFEADVMRFVELHDASVVLEHADAPVLIAKVAADLLSSGKDRLFEQIIESPLSFFVAIGDSPTQRLVAAVFAPRLRDRLEFNVGGISAELLVVGLNGLHFDEREAQLPGAADRHQRLVVGFADRDGAFLEGSR